MELIGLIMRGRGGRDSSQHDDVPARDELINPADPLRLINTSVR